MARLILVNGLPGSGKSTLSRLYVEDHPLSLRLDIDDVRGLIGAWKDHPHPAYALGRKLAVAMARVALAEGRDVIVPQFLGRPAFIEELAGLAAAMGVPFHETMLLEPLRAARLHLLARAAGPMTRSQSDAHEMLDRAGGLDALGDLHRRLREVLSLRPRTVTLTPVRDDIARTYRSLLASLR